MTDDKKKKSFQWTEPRNEGPRPRDVGENPFKLRNIGTDAKPERPRPNLAGLPPIVIGKREDDLELERQFNRDVKLTLGTFFVLVAAILAISGF